MASAYKKISELTSIATIDKDNDLLPIVDSSEQITKKISVATLVGVGSAQVYILDAETDCEVTTGVYYFRVPLKYHGRKLVDVAACSIIAGVTGAMTIQIYNVRRAQNLLTSLIRIDSGETDTKDSSIQPVINTSYETVNEGDLLRIDIVTIHTTPAKGLIVDMAFL